MELQKYFDSIQTKLVDAAHVKTVFGEPITTQNRTIIPVAKVRYAFGGGFGAGPSRPSQGGGETNLGHVGGGGGGVMAKPVGVVEVSPEGTRFIPISNRKRTAAVAAVAFFLGTVWGWRRSR